MKSGVIVILVGYDPPQRVEVFLTRRLAKTALRMIVIERCTVQIFVPEPCTIS
jgi:hypothetical protein